MDKQSKVVTKEKSDESKKNNPQQPQTQQPELKASPASSVPIAKNKKKYNYKKKTGRPPKTLEDLPENWEEIVMLGSLAGKFEEQIKRDILIAGGENLKSMNMLWAKLKEREPDFREAVKKGELLRKAWWLDKAQKGINTTFFNTALWFIVMKNCFGWKDKTEIDHGLNDDLLEKYKDMKAHELLAQARRIAATVLGNGGAGSGNRPAQIPQSP